MEEDCYLLQIFIQGHEHLNRAIDGDIVAVQMLPKEKWSCPSSMVMDDEEEKGDEEVDIEVSMVYMSIQRLTL